MVIKELIFSFQNDFKSIKNGLLLFSVINLLLNIVPWITVFNDTKLETDMDLFVFFLWVFFSSLFQFFLVINFQRYYSQKKQIKCGFSKISTIIYQNIKVVVAQFIIMVLLVIILSILVFALDKIFNENSIIQVIFLFICIMGIIIWLFSRLLFVINILVYKRDSYSLKEIVNENSRLIKNNLSIVAGIFTCYFLYTLIIYIPIKYPELFVVNTQINNCIGGLLGLLTQIVLITIVVLEKTKEENQLTTAST